MRIAVLGTGAVGRTIAERLSGLGHQVVMGTRDPAETLSRAEPDPQGNPPFSEWSKAHDDIAVETFADAAAEGELVVNATNGVVSLAALDAAGEDNLAGKVLLDIANPLDSSGGMPPRLSVSNDDSLAEQIQRRFPAARVVKALNTVTAALMVDPQALAGGDHTVLVSGNDEEAKDQVTSLLHSFGWSDVLDMGDITSARGAEMYLPLWLRLWGAVGTPRLNVKIVRS